jgi:hypothetical protein
MYIDGARNTISKMFDEFQENYEYLMTEAQISFANDYKSQFTKVLLLSVASYFEVKVTELLKQILLAEQCIMVKSFLDKKALSRQYHTLFQWDQGAKGVNQFFGYLGTDFKSFMSKKQEASTELQDAIADFMQLGAARNSMVHGNYATFKLDMTADDVKQKFESALIFVDGLLTYAEEFRNR